ncbi:erythromycin esterase family protein [Kribbella sp. NPDC051620]|uniref:erythromycin esterase family protein n=1 Tax=Kribbella sp. NPDC051620 TaxID=3364120 RepID=UPI00379AC7D4
MSQDIRDFVPPYCELLGLGEPTHQEPAFGLLRNDLFAALVDQGFRSVALETDRVSALLVDDYVQGGAGDLDTVMSQGFSHRFGELVANRRLVGWMREYNAGRPADERVSFHGFDASTENTSAASPRIYLEHARDYLGLELELDRLLGDDEQWSRDEAILDPAQSLGDTPSALQLRVIADDLLTTLYARAPERIAATSRADWYRARTHLTTGLGLLRYHKQATVPGPQEVRIGRLMAARDSLMAQNLLDIRGIEAERGPTLVFAHNAHVQRMTEPNREWYSAGSIVAELLGERYAVIAGSLGSSETLGLAEPAPDTYEGALQRGVTTWGLIPASAIQPALTRTDIDPRRGYFPLDQGLLDQVDAVLHIQAGSSALE